MGSAAAGSTRLRLLGYISVGLLLGAFAAVAIIPAVRDRLFGPLQSASFGRALVGGHFSLIDQTGRRVSDQDFRGRFMLVMFGFTYCPDVCPSELQVIAAALDKLGSKAERVVPLFITVDPERDTPSQLAIYLKSFDPRLIGLTGTTEEIATATKAYRVYARKAPDPKSTAGYTMDHSALIYLMGPDGGYRAHFAPGIGVDALAERIKQELS
jgi:cytochrome oxidase Cu insertion factor (SCO1/SenC/PrrC family)